MILSKDDKFRFSDAMQYFKELLEREIKLINENVELKLVSFGIPIENHNDILYFDFPYTENVDEINNSLLPNHKYDDVDVKMYDLLDSSGSGVKYIAYNFLVEDSHIKISDSYHTSLSTNDIETNDGLVDDFFKIMYYSAFPDEWPGVDKVEASIKKVKGSLFERWFIVIHNEDIKDSSNTILSNYCITLNSSFTDVFNNDLKDISSKLKKFSQFYGSKDFNVILRKNVEYSDMVLSLNYELFHHIKELHSNFTMEPIREFRNKSDVPEEINLIFENTKRIQEFYENYMELVRANFLNKDTINLNNFFQENDFKSFLKEIEKRNTNFSVQIAGDLNRVVVCLLPCLNIIIREIILNAVKAFKIQEIENKKIFIYCEILNDTNNLQFTIVSEATEYICSNEEDVGQIPLQSNFERGQTGVGIFLINNLLRKLTAYCYNLEKQLYFNIQEKHNSVVGYSFQFALPLYLKDNQ